MEAGEWLNAKFLEWEKTFGVRKTLVEFADYLEVPLASLSDWMNGKYRPRGAKNIARLAEKLGPEIYGFLGMPVPEFVNFDQLPPGIAGRLRRAVLEARVALADRGYKSDTPGAEKITCDVFSKHGFTIMDITDED